MFYILFSPINIHKYCCHLDEICSREETIFTAGDRFGVVLGVDLAESFCVDGLEPDGFEEVDLPRDFGVDFVDASGLGFTTTGGL